MSIELPTERPSIPLANYTRGRTAFADDWKTLAKANHWTFSRTRSLIGGLVWRDTAFATTATSYARSSSNSTRDFDTWTPIIELPRRHWGSSSFRVGVACYIYGSNIDVSWSLNATDTNTAYAGTTAAQINTASWQHAAGEQIVTASTAHLGSSTANDYRQFAINVLARRNGFASTGQLWAITFYSIVLTSAQIPSVES